MDKFLATYNLPRLIKEDIDSLNRFITRNITEAVIKMFHQEKIQDLMASKFYKTFKEKVTVLFKLSKILNWLEPCQTFYEAIITLTPKASREPSK